MDASMCCNIWQHVLYKTVRQALASLHKKNLNSDEPEQMIKSVTVTLQCLDQEMNLDILLLVAVHWWYSQ